MFFQFESILCKKFNCLNFIKHGDTVVRKVNKLKLTIQFYNYRNGRTICSINRYSTLYDELYANRYQKSIRKKGRLKLFLFTVFLKWVINVINWKYNTHPIHHTYGDPNDKLWPFRTEDRLSRFLILKTSNTWIPQLWIP